MEWYSEARRPEDAISVGESLLDLNLPAAMQDRMLFRVGGKYSEMGNHEQAYENMRLAFESTSGWLDVDTEFEATCRLNYANTLKSLGHTQAALTEYTKAERLSGQRNPILLCQIDAMRGDLFSWHGRRDECYQAFRRGNARLHKIAEENIRQRFHAIAGMALSRAGYPVSARFHLDRAASLLREMLADGPHTSTWHSMLIANHHLFALQVENRLVRGRRTAVTEEALVIAEGSKSRLTAWTKWYDEPEGAEVALSLERQRQAVASAKHWTEQRRGRLVLSFHCSANGLAIFAIRDGGVRATWCADAADRDWRRRFEPWYGELPDVASGSPTWRLMGSVTESLLDWLGELIARVAKQLGSECEELIVVAHRFLHGLPFAHARLPGGERLSDKFARISTLPTLAEFAEQLRWPGWSGEQTGVVALTDADGDLPFARAEGQCIPRDDHHTGSAVDHDTMMKTLNSADHVLISCHGVFDTDNTFDSHIRTADEPVTISALFTTGFAIRTRLIVLGVCEAGQATRLLSDEPYGLSTMLCDASNGAVVAPLWPVDDFTAFIFVVRLFESLHAGEHPGESLLATAKWMRKAQPADLLDFLDEHEQKVEDNEGFVSAVAEIRDWLEGLEEVTPPLGSALDWAAFQFHGLYKPQGSPSEEEP